MTEIPSLFSQALGGALIASGVFVALGLYTSMAGAAMALTMATLAYLVPRPPLSILNGPLGAGILVLLGMAIALLGAGAFSLDFRLFGRREIIIPRASGGDVGRRETSQNHER